jgi:hypothetical protein
VEDAIDSRIDRLFCPDCWRIVGPGFEAERAKAEAATFARTADLRKRSKLYPWPTASEVTEARSLFDRLRARYSAELLQRVERVLRNYGPNLPADLLHEIEELTSQGFSGREPLGYMQDDESGYKWLWSGESKPCHIDTRSVARIAREFLEMDRARRKGE